MSSSAIYPYGLPHRESGDTPLSLSEIEKKGALIHALLELTGKKANPQGAWSPELRKTMEGYKESLVRLLQPQGIHKNPWVAIANAAEPYMREHGIQSVQELLELAH